jgi:MFS family permease
MRFLPPAFAYRDFGLFWMGAGLSATGTQFTTVAMAWQIYELTSSPLYIGFLGLARALPQICLALLGGILADAFDRRRLLMAAQVVQCAISVALGLLTLAGAITPEILIGAALLLALGSAVESPPRQAIVANLVPPAALSSAVALNATQRSAAMIVGPSLAGVALALSGPLLCYVIDAASWLVMLGALANIRLRPTRERRIGVSFEALWAGARFVLHQQVMFRFMLLDFGATFFGTSTALYPIFARDILETGPTGLGLMYAAPSVGALVTGVVLSGRHRVEATGKWVVLGVVLFGACTALFSVSRVFWLSLVLLVGTGIGNTLSAVLRNTTNQLLTPDQLRGRVSSVNSAFVISGPQLGQFRAGAMADVWGATASGAIGGLGAVVCALAIAPGVWRFKLRHAASRS